MVVCRSLSFALGVVSVLGVALALAAPASASWKSDARAIGKGLAISVAKGRLTRTESAAYRVEVKRTRRRLPRLSFTNATNLGVVFHDVAAQSRRFTRARALTLFAELRTNRVFLRSHPMPPARTDVLGSNGVLYRSFPWQGLRFHPLGNFGRLNSLLTRDRLGAARRLANALAARRILRPGRTAVWEYYFRFGSGYPPWTSGMAQAVGAHSLSRAATRLGDSRLMAVATRAYRAVPRRLTLRLWAGPWVRHYSFSRLLVLNSQLQTAISVARYAALSGNGGGARFASRLRTSSARLLPSFDTGYWSYYSPGNESPLRYHLYVIKLLDSLAERTDYRLWAATAARFDRYTREPPKLRGRPTRRLLYPWPADGFRDGTTIRFWLSKISTVRLRVGGESRTLSLRKGRHRLTWYPGRREPGLYRPKLRATDLAGNRARKVLAPVRIAIDRKAPEVTAWISGRRVVWRAKDRATPWIRLKLVLTRPQRRRVIPLGIRELRGSARFKRPAWLWRAKLVVFDSSGNRSSRRLGIVGGA